MDTMPSFPEECSNESLYCSTPSDSTPDYKPLSPESTHSLEADVKPNLFSKDVLLEPHESVSPSMNHRLEPPELQLFEQTDGAKSSPESPHSENGSDRLDSESGRSRHCFPLFWGFRVSFISLFRLSSLWSPYKQQDMRKALNFYPVLVNTHVFVSHGQNYHCLCDFLRQSIEWVSFPEIERNVPTK